MSPIVASAAVRDECTTVRRPIRSTNAVKLPGLPPLRPAYWDALQTGELIRGSKHATRSAIAAACARAGYTLWEFRDLIGYAESGRALFPTEKLVTKHFRDASRLIAATPSGASKVENRREIALIRSALGTWVGHNRIRDRRVLDAVHAAADDLGTLVLAVSTRSFGIATGFSHSRVAKALESLVNHGWLTLVTPPSGTAAARYRLTQGRYDELEPVGVPSSAIPPKGDGPGTVMATLGTPSPHDVWANGAGALGEVARELYDALTAEPATADELVTRTGMARRTFFRHMRALREAGLAAHTGAGYVRVECDDMDALAASLGAEPVLQARADRYRAEQRHWAGMCTATRRVVIDARSRFASRVGGAA